MPFREAHHVTGAIVKAAEAKGVDLDGLALCRHAGGRAAHHKSRIFGALCRKFGEKPDQLWGNRATERAQNGASMVEAVGKGAGEGLEPSAEGLPSAWADGF